MPFRVETADDVAVIKLTHKSLEDPTAEAAGEQLLRLADEQGRDEVEVDLGEVPYLSSMWLGKLVAVPKRMRSRGARLRVVNVTAPVFEVFQVTCLHKVLDVRPREAGEPPSRP
jgi:anti-anti-sigma factor